MNNKVNKTFWRWYFFGSCGWNYEKMQGLGYYYTTLPMTEDYKNTEDKKKIADTQLQFFNTNNTMAPIILGVDAALQQEKGVDSADTLAAIKTGMMGPLAGIGDTLFHVIPSTIIGSISSYMALEGNPVALLLWVFFGFFRLFCMRKFYIMGYKEGSKIVSEIGERLKKVTKCANILGITVIGALIPSVVKAKFGFEFVWGEVTLSLQNIADQIMPALAPTIIVFLTYWLLGRKQMNSTRVTIFLVILGIVLYNLKILGI